MDYPPLPQGIETTENRLNGLQSERSSNGVARARLLFPAQKRTFNVIHPLLTQDQKTLLETFINDNLGLTFNFRYQVDGQTYTCIFSQDAAQYRRIGQAYWAATVPMTEV